MSYRPLYEDPTYDDDGQCVDEDADWEDMEACYTQTDPEEFGPYSTINS
jgi:hypothetical protein